MGQRIVLVGHCGVDAPRLEREVSKSIPRAEVLCVNTEMQLQDVVDEGADLFLVNRQLPYGFESEEGVELIHELQQMHPDAKTMLVSNYAEAQAEALAAGAVPGFGKRELGQPRVVQLIREALAFDPQVSSPAASVAAN